MALFPFAIGPLLSERQQIGRSLKYLLCCGILSVTLYNTLIYIAAHTTVTVNMAVINESTPLFILLFARLLLGEKFTRLKILGVLMTTLGVLLLVSNGHLKNLINLSFRLGDLWVLAAAITFGLYSILIKKRPADLSLVSFTFMTFILGWLLLAPLFWWETSTSDAVVAYNLKLLGVIFYLGVFASIIAYVAWTRAVQLLGPGKIGIDLLSVTGLQWHSGDHFSQRTAERCSHLQFSVDRRRCHYCQSTRQRSLIKHGQRTITGWKRLEISAKFQSMKCRYDQHRSKKGDYGKRYY